MHSESNCWLAARNWVLRDNTKGSDTFALFDVARQPFGENLTGIVLDMLARIGVVLLLFEVGLIFAQVGQGLKMPDGSSVVDKGTLSAIVVMVMVTTMITPPLLKWAMKPDESPEASD